MEWIPRLLLLLRRLLLRHRPSPPLTATHADACRGIPGRML